jgi:hypothetical protein
LFGLSDAFTYYWGQIDKAIAEFHEKRSHITTLDKTSVMIGSRDGSSSHDNGHVEKLMPLLPICIERGFVKVVSGYAQWTVEVL